MSPPAIGSLKQGIRAVAARAGVSTASVSRAINNPDAVSPSLRARITQAIEAVGYIPHAPARILSSRRSRTLGAIVPTIDNTMFARGISSLQKYLSSVGYMLFLTTSGYDLDTELEQARNLIGRGVDGLVLRGDCHHDALRKLLADNAVPFINVGIYRPDRPYPCVGTDNEAAAYRAAAHVVELGHIGSGSSPRSSATTIAPAPALPASAARSPMAASSCRRNGMSRCPTRSTMRARRRAICSASMTVRRPSSAATTSSPMACCWKPSAAAFRCRATFPWSASTISTGAGICGRA